MASPGCSGLLLVLLVFSVSQISPSEGCGRGSINISNNQYKGILIAIGENVPENQTLIDRIRDVFTEASEFLHTATKYRAYFKEITILVPKTWANRPEYEPLGDETYDKSDIVVDLPDADYGQTDQPFVIKTTPCGELGYYMHLTPDYLLDSNVASKYGPYDKLLVHEWAHLRYGVYDEYPVGENAPHFYAAAGGKVEGTRCSKSLPGSMYNSETGTHTCNYINGLPEPSCRFLDDENVPDKYGSLMYRQYLDHVEHFCDNDANDDLTLHNAEAPTQQNLLCQGRSVWEVLRAHPDFADGANPPDNELPTTEPDFKVVRQMDKRTVLILDVSGSMAINDRIGKLNQGCNTFISSIAMDGEEIGIVTFFIRATTEIGMTLVNNATRVELLTHLPTNPNGGTSIGSGISEGLDELERSGGTAGATLIVVSDGEENTSPFIRDVTDRVLASNVTLHSIAITQDADSALDAVALATGGLSFLYSETDTSNAINEAFQAIGELNKNPSERSYQLLSTAWSMGSGQTYSDHVYIDFTLGINTEFTFDYEQSQGVDFSLTEPSGLVYTSASDECTHDTTFYIHRCKFPGMVEAGKWVYNVTSNASGNQRIAVSVTSQPSSGEYPIIAQAVWAKRDIDLGQGGNGPDKQALYVSVSKGYVAVLNADVEATVDRPVAGGSITRKQEDNGGGADLVKDDGIYSRYFVPFNGDGRYNVKVSVNSNPTTVISPTIIIGRGASRYGTKELRNMTDVPTGAFQRLSSGGAFNVAGYVPGPIYPPGQVMDLTVVAVNQTDGIVTVQWTAMGGQLDEGQADVYNIRYSTDFDELRENFTSSYNVTSDMIYGVNLTLPLEAGEIETAEIKVPETGITNITYYFAVAAGVLDGDGYDYSDPSNIASASMSEFIVDDDTEDPDDSDSLSTGAIVGIVFGAIAGLALIALIVILIIKKTGSSSATTVTTTGANNKSFTVEENKYANI
jgi:calcium-activated chloride channel regulator 4